MANLSCISSILILLVTVGILCRAQEPDGPHDVRWRLDNGIQALSRHLITVNKTGFKPPVNFTDEQIPIEELCDLLLYYELANKVYNDSSITAILKQSINDSCKWVKFLLENQNRSSGYNPELSSGSGTDLQPADCAPEGITLLHLQCLRRRQTDNQWLMDKVIGPVRNYTVHTAHVTNPDVSEWFRVSNIS